MEAYNRPVETDEAVMSHREKVAWLSLAAMAVAFGPYFAIVSTGRFGGTLFHQLGLFALTALVQLLILGVGYLVLDRISPHEARTPPDERDLAITRSSTTSAYYVLMVGMILVGVVMPFNSKGWHIVNSALFMIVLAEFVKYAVVASSYRMQS